MDFLASLFGMKRAFLPPTEAATVSVLASTMASNDGDRIEIVTSPPARAESRDPSDEEGHNNKLQAMGVSAASSTARSADYAEAIDDDDDDDDDMFVREIVYQEPYPDFYRDCWEYFPISSNEYGLRRVGSERIHYLVRETSVVFHWCVELERAVRQAAKAQTAAPQANDTAALSHAQQVKSNTAIVEDRVPGVLGVFVEYVLQNESTFAFQRADKSVKLVNFKTATTAQSSNNNAGVTTVQRDGTPLTLTKKLKDIGIPLMHNDYRLDERRDVLSDIMCGRKRMWEYYDIDKDVSRMHLKRFDWQGETGQRAEAAVKTQPPFTTISPVTPAENRWYVIGAQYWELFVAYQRMHERSGALLYRMQQLLQKSEAENIGITQLLGAGQADRDITPDQQRRIVARILDIERAESERDRVLQNCYAQLGHAADRLAAMKSDLNRIKVEKPSFIEKLANHESSESILKTFGERIADVEKALASIKTAQLERRTSTNRR